MHGGTVSYRFVPSRSGLEAFFRRYEEERARGGMSATLLHVTPRQRVDTIVLIVGLNASRAWNRIGSESAESLWLRYATPLLAETREQAAALAIAAAGGLPGAFLPPIRPDPTPPPEVAGFEADPTDARPPRGRRAAWKLKLAALAERTRYAVFRHRRTRAGAAAALVVLALVAGHLAGLNAALVHFLDPPNGGTTLVSGATTQTGVVPHAASEPLDVAEDPAGEAFRAALSVTLAAALQHNGSVTPRALAEIYAGESDLSAEPEVFLGAMLLRWPAPPDRSLPRDGVGARALLDYAASFAAIESGRDAAVLPLDRGTPEDERLRDGLRGFADGSDAGELLPATFPAWPPWTRWLAFLPLLPALAVAVLTFRPAVRASLVNPPEGVTGVRIDLPLDGLILSAPKPERRLARSLAWREPAAGRGLDAERSVRVTIDRGGFLTQVPVERPHIAEYLFLIRRRCLNDHERDRASRLVDALATGGLSVHVYDYDPDPRSLTPRIAGKAGRAPPSLDLRGLREQHPDARLVLVTDGSELVDFFTLRPLPFVAEELSTWPARMLLTPVPMTEWGEREMNIVEAIGGGIGRATVEGFRDLEAAFGARSRQKRPAAGSRPPGDAGLIQRVVDWLIDTERRLGGDDGLEARPAAIRLDELFLRSEVPPPAETVGELLRDLHAWLGSRGYLWLAACACYPQLRFSVTNYLGLKVTLPYGATAVPVYSEKLLAQLALLPWFRSGHMPLWLRRALLGSLSTDALGRARQGIDELLNGSGVLPEGQSPDARLPIWRSEVEGLEIPPDEVMADLMAETSGAEEPALRGDAFERILGPHRQRALAVRGGALLMTALWCAVAWWLWPDPSAAPHPQGAWLPLVALCLFTLLAFLAAAGLRRWGHIRLQAPGVAVPLAEEPAR